MPGGIGRGSLGSRGGGKGQGGRRGNMDMKMAGFGPAGTCECPRCGYIIPHQAGNPCSGIKCPKCDVQMVRGT